MPLSTRVWGAGRLLVLAAALAATYGVFFMASLRIAGQVREVEVPDVRGQSISTAMQTLADAGLTIRIDPLRRPDPKVPTDHVMTQEPAPGTVLRRQRPVKVRVSDGLRAPVVPLVVGEAERSAQIRLGQERVTLAATAEIRSSDYGNGVVVAQDPPAKRQAASVSLLVNRGEQTQTYVMPDIIGTSATAAAGLLRMRGFRVALVDGQPYPGLPSGVVVRQTPDAGFQVAKSDLISLEVSR